MVKKDIKALIINLTKLIRKNFLIIIVIALVSFAISLYLYQKSYYVETKISTKSMAEDQVNDLVKGLDSDISNTTNIAEKVSAYYARIYLFQSISDDESAISTALELIKLDPSNPSYYGEVALMYSNVGDTTKAIEYYNKAISACDALPISDDNTDRKKYYNEQINGLSNKE